MILATAPIKLCVALMDVVEDVSTAKKRQKSMVRIKTVPSYTMVSSGLLQNIRRVSPGYTHEPLGECVCQENTTDTWDFLQ